jgi:hypothetical protein
MTQDELPPNLLSYLNERRSFPGKLGIVILTGGKMVAAEVHRHAATESAQAAHAAARRSCPAVADDFDLRSDAYGSVAKLISEGIKGAAIQNVVASALWLASEQLATLALAFDDVELVHVGIEFISPDSVETTWGFLRRSQDSEMDWIGRDGNHRSICFH